MSFAHTTLDSLLEPSDEESTAGGSSEGSGRPAQFGQTSH